jgi:hypothetical protein
MLIIGNELGVYYTADGGAHWAPVGDALPVVPVMDLRVHEPTSTLFAATFGRGMWKTALPVPDADGDGVPDADDNCTLLANPTQCDSDGDGYGNLCDGDLDNSGIVNFADLGLMKAAFFSTPASPNWNPDADLDCNGSVSFVDLGGLKSEFFGPPGPSGLVTH